MIATAELILLLTMAWPWVERVSAVSGGDAGTADFFVSPLGKDMWSGKLADPGENDGPFATISRARDAMRVLLQTRKEPQPVRVVLRGGTYYLDSPLEFGPEDSGTEQAPVVYSAAAGEKVVLSGGRRLEGGRWGEVNGRKAWVVDIPEVKEGQWRFRQLFVNGQRRPRLPKEGEYRIESLPDFDKKVDPWDQNFRRFVFSGTDIQRWHNLRDVEVMALVRWRDNRLPIQEVDVADRIVTFDRKTMGGLFELYVSHPSTYWVENVLEALDAPSQWYLDRPLGRLYCLPASGEDLAAAEIIAPRLAQVLRVVGRGDAMVKHLHFEGITFAHSEWQPPANWAGSSQAAIDVPGAVFLAHANQCSLSQSVIEHVGNYGVEVGEGCTDVAITHCRMTDLGGGGAKVGHGSARTTVADNEIGHGGRLFMSAVGVWVGHSPENKIVHNHIHDLHYTGVSVGWQWDFEPSKAIGNLIEHNHIHDLGHGLLSDMGGIYTLGVSPGTRLRYNVVHDVNARAYGGLGIYPDEGSSEIVIEKNLVFRCRDGALFAHHNRNVTAENNIFAFNRSAQIERGGIGGFELTCRRNLVYYKEGKAVGDYGSGNDGRDVCAFDHNLYWITSGEPVLFGNKTFAQWQAAGQDKDSLIADPLFVDPEHGNFTLRPGSPAAQIGFEPWQMSAVGPRPPSATPKRNAGPGE